MARSFVASNLDRYVTSNALSSFISASAGTFVCWAKLTGTAPTITNVYDASALFSDNGQYAGLHRGIISGSDQVWAYNYDGSVDRVGASYSAGMWTHWAWVHTGGTLYLYKDGSQAGSTASGDTQLLTSIVNIGPGLTYYLDGTLAELAFWSVGLAANELAAIAKGVSPRRIQVASLKAYWPLQGILSPEPDWVGVDDLAVSQGSPAQANHSPSLLWTPRWPTQTQELAVAGHPTMRRWGGVPYLTPGPPLRGRRW